jgi:hypothetical protein
MSNIRSVTQSNIKNFEEYLININERIHKVKVYTKIIPAPFTDIFTAYYYQKGESEITIGFLDKDNGDIYSSGLKNDSALLPIGNVNDKCKGIEYIGSNGSIILSIHIKSLLKDKVNGDKTEYNDYQSIKPESETKSETESETMFNRGSYSTSNMIKIFEKQLVNVNENRRGTRNQRVVKSRIVEGPENKILTQYYYEDKRIIILGFLEKSTGNIYSSRLSKENYVPAVGNINISTHETRCIKNDGFIRLTSINNYVDKEYKEFNTRMKKEFNDEERRIRSIYM